jgi:hypothetical protein
MSGEITPGTALIESSGAVPAALAPVVDAPAPSLPAGVEPAAPLVVADEHSPTIVAPAVAAPVAEPVREPTAFEKFETAKPVEVPAVETKPVAEVKYDFKLPEALKADDAKILEFTNLLKEGSVSPEIGQKLIDMHAAAMTEYAQNVVPAAQHATWRDTVKGWSNRTKGDGELGGSGYETTMQAAARMRNMLVSSAKPGTAKYKQDMTEFQEFDAATHASSHPALIRILNNAARYLDEPQAHELPVEIKPAKGNGKPPGSGIYSHPSSKNMGT